MSPAKSSQSSSAQTLAPLPLKTEALITTKVERIPKTVKDLADMGAIVLLSPNDEENAKEKGFSLMKRMRVELMVSEGRREQVTKELEELKKQHDALKQKVTLLEAELKKQNEEATEQHDALKQKLGQLEAEHKTGREKALEAEKDKIRQEVLEQHELQSQCKESERNKQIEELIRRLEAERNEWKKQAEEKEKKASEWIESLNRLQKL